MSDNESGAPRTKWSRSQRFQLSPAGREAGLNYRQVIVTGRSLARVQETTAQLAAETKTQIFTPLELELDAGLTADPRFFPNGDDFHGLRVHQTRLQGGDASSDSYCHTS